MTSPGFAEFYGDSRDRCLRAVAVAVGDAGVAEELVAEAYARAFARWRSVARHPAPAAWVVRTALNLAVSRWRVRRREVLADPTTLRGDLPAADVESAGFDPSLAVAVARLPRRQREVLTLRLLVDLDTATTARLLGISPGAVTAHLHRATAGLRKYLTPLTAEEHTP